MTARLLPLNLLTSLVFMTIVWVIAWRRQRLDTVDTAWGLGFVVLAVSTLLLQPGGRNWLILGLVIVWGGRLSLFLGRRSRGRREDPRYAELSRAWGRHVWRHAYGAIFLTQGVLTWVISWPIMLASGVSLPAANRWLVAGTVVWLIGYLFEVVADHQLRSFLKRPERPPVMDQGLWHYSRHPNYFGEITQWTGIAVISCGAGWGWLGFVGPLVLAYVIIFISGVRLTEKKHAADPAWRAYQRRTSVLIPLPPKS